MNLSWEPEKLTPIFHSEISSSYLLAEFLDSGNNCIDFLSYVHGKDPKFFDPQGFMKEGKIKREHFYPGKGSIDILINLKNSLGEKVIILLEVKVHDYFSVTREQIKTYIEAARSSELGKVARVYFLYLTQFTKADFDVRDDCKTPATVLEFDNARKEFGGDVTHISWSDFYDFLDSGYLNQVDPTLKLLLEMQRSWMTKKIEDDLEENVLSNDMKTLEYYFPNTPKRIEELIMFGTDLKKTKTGDDLRIDLAKLDEEKLALITDVIQNYADGPDVDKTQLGGPHCQDTNFKILSYKYMFGHGD